MANFDHDKMLAFALAEIRTFAAAHGEEVFYGFSIDASLLCLNSEAAFASTLATYQAKWPARYAIPEVVRELRLNTGDWEYQGFADLTDCEGYDRAAYSQHYKASEQEQRTSSYALAMDALVQALLAENAFAPLKRSADFFANRVEHNY